MGLLNLLARIGLDTSGFESGLARSQRSTDRFGSNFTRTVGGAVLGVFTVQKLTAFTRETIRAGQEILEMARASGKTTDEIQLARDGVITFNEEALKSIALLDEAGNAATRAGQQMVVAFAKPITFLVEGIAKAVTGLTMIGKGFAGAQKEVDKQFPGFTGPAALFTPKFWRAFRDGFLREANAVRDAAAIGEPTKRPAGITDKTKQELKERTRIEEQIAQRRRELAMDALDTPGKIAALEKEIADIRGPGLEKPSPQQELALLDKQLELQRLQSARGGLGVLSDSLRAVGRFGGENANSPAIRHLSKMERHLYEIERNTGRNGTDSTSFPL